MATPTAVPPILAATLTHETPSSTASLLAARTSPTSEIRIVNPHEYKLAAATLAEAFRDDPVVQYSIDTPDNAHLSESERYALHVQSMEYVTYAHCLNGLVLTIGDFDCVALWLPPGKNIDDYWTILRSGMWRLNWTLTAEGRERFFGEFLPLLGRSKREVMGSRDGGCWYLNYIGTREAGRGRGYARKLVEYVTKMADEEGQACYLESSHDVNLIIYRKMGFELKKQIWLVRDVVKRRMDVMVREPGALPVVNELGKRKEG